MKQSDESNAGGVILGAVVGLICGAAVGLLFAPKAGSETREDIADLINKGRRKGEELVEQGRDKFNEAKSRVMQGGKEPFYESGKYT